jgi:hypothetical protein
MIALLLLLWRPCALPMCMLLRPLLLSLPLPLLLSQVYVQPLVPYYRHA